ncbi:single-stranded DNA-binding protein [Lujinxingia vulgaris]|uniref:Single-stranded DNA-binding protein n=1 Tax=Lujinxingia vulgaris TaxID=2600176 RepID=A0A5C6XD74_9DELT|nr:uracil-DNA glycosylase family protein [Lujinxingia vulgaris]TXD40787.1 single-stranded DNA-binding protein [Lujinxingia vulgaris]
MNPIAISERLVEELKGVAFEPPISHAYQPLEYAWESHKLYLERYGQKRPRPVMLVGMNPGPWGMAQNGVPFGTIEMVRDWMGVEAPVGQPDELHPKRPVDGFACSRSEVSGSRLWGWAQEHFGTAERFFETFFVHNYCPLLILDEDGKNRTPPQLRKGEKAQVLPPCDRALRELVAYFEPQWVIGVGAFAEKSVQRALKKSGFQGTIGRVLHPSPASPAANRGWAAQAQAQLEALGVPLDAP